jgi:hypothetical protein
MKPAEAGGYSFWKERIVAGEQGSEIRCFQGRNLADACIVITAFFDTP